MTRDDIIRMAQEAELKCSQHWDKSNMDTEHMKRFADLVAAAEREACAKVVEQYTGAWSDEGYALAQAIRARGVA